MSALAGENPKQGGAQEPPIDAKSPLREVDPAQLAIEDYLLSIRSDGEIYNLLTNPELGLNPVQAGRITLTSRIEEHNADYEFALQLTPLKKIKVNDGKPTVHLKNEPEIETENVMADVKAIDVIYIRTPRGHHSEEPILSENIRRSAALMRKDAISLDDIRKGIDQKISQLRKAVE